MLEMNSLQEAKKNRLWILGPLFMAPEGKSIFWLYIMSNALVDIVIQYV